MVGTTNGSRTPITPRQAFSVVSGGQDPGLRSGPGSVAGSDCGGIEFTREEVEALLNVKIRTKDKFNLKEKCEIMMEYIKSLRMCVRWFQDFEGDLSLEHEKLKKLFESAKKKSNEMEMLMNAKEEELNSTIEELQMNYSVLQEKFAKEETDKLAAIETLMTEKDARMTAERSQPFLNEDLEKALRESSSANEKGSNRVWKKVYAPNIEQGQAMEKSMIYVAREIERLQAELANADKRALAVAAAAATNTQGTRYATGYGKHDNVYPGPYAIASGSGQS